MYIYIYIFFFLFIYFHFVLSIICIYISLQDKQYVHLGRKSCCFSSGQCSCVYYCECSEGQSDLVLATGPVINMTPDSNYHLN